MHENTDIYPWKCWKWDILSVWTLWTYLCSVSRRKAGIHIEYKIILRGEKCTVWTVERICFLAGDDVWTLHKFFRWTSGALWMISVVYHLFSWLQFTLRRHLDGSQLQRLISTLASCGQASVSSSSKGIWRYLVNCCFT